MKRVGILIAAALATLLAIGCSNTSHSADETPVSNKARVSVVVDNNARTALPDNPANSAFTKFVLTGSLAAGEAQTLSPADGWVATGDYATAYAAMQAALLELDVGSWSFTLTATIAGSNAESTVYTGTASALLSAGSNVTLTFPLSISSVGETGTGGIAITLSVAQTITNLSAVEVKLTTVSGEAVNASVQAPTSINGTYSFEEIDVGNYVVTFAFKDADGNTLGICPEYALVTAGNTSTSTVSISSLDATYTITYMDASANNAELTGLSPVSYTRHAGVTLPIASKSGYTFCGWYTTPALAVVDDTTGTPVTRFASGNVGNKTYYAKFIANAEVSPIAAVTIDGTVKVGETVTAKAWIDAATQTAFTGTVFSYQWSKATAADGTYTAIENATNATYTLLPEDAGAYLKVAVRQKYTASDNDGVHTIAIATAENAESVNAAFASTASAIAKGTLDANSLVLTFASGSSDTRLVYNSGDVVSIGATLLDNLLNTTTGTVSNTVSTASSAQRVTVALSFNEGTTATVIAPVSSGYVSVWLKAEGYTPVQVTRDSGATSAGIGEVYITVKANQPEPSVVSLAQAQSVITSGKVSFTNVSSNSLYEWIVSESNPSATASGWTAVPYDSSLANNVAQFYVNNCFLVPGGSTLYIRVAASGTEDEVGYIAPSDATALTINDANIGSLQALTKLTASYNTTEVIANVETNSEHAVVQTGYTITITALNTANTDISNNVSYQWYRGETAISGATSNAYTVTADDVESILKVTATQTVTDDETNSSLTVPVSWVTAESVQKGTLQAASDYYLLYEDKSVSGDSNFYATLGDPLTVQWLYGSTTSPQSKLVKEVTASTLYSNGTASSASAAINAATGLPVSVSFAFTGSGYYGTSTTTIAADTTVPNGSGYVTVIANAAGYKPLAMDVAIDVKGVTPTLNDVTGGTYSLDKWLSTAVENITYGYVEFLAQAYSDGVQYSSDGSSSWAFVNIGEFNHIKNPTLYLRIGTHTGETQRSLANATRSNDKYVYDSSSCQVAGTDTDAVSYSTNGVFSSRYCGKRSVIIAVQDDSSSTTPITFSNHEIRLVAGTTPGTTNVLTATPEDAGDKISAWYIDGNLITVTDNGSGGYIGTYSINGTTVAELNFTDRTLTFVAGAAPSGTTEAATRYYRVTVEGVRNNTIPLTTTKVIAVTSTSNQ